MEVWRSLVLPALVPFGVGLALLLPPALILGRRGGSRGEPSPLRVPFAGGLALAGGYASSSWLLVGPPQWPAISADERLLWLVLAAALVGAAAGLRPRPSRPALLALATLALGGSWWILERALEHHLAGPDGWLVVGAVGLAVLGLALALAAQSRRRPGFLTPALLSATACAAAGVLVLGRTAKLGQHAGALAAVLAAAALIGLWRPRLDLAGGATAAYALGLVGLLAAGVVFNEVARSAALLVLVAPLAAAILELPGLRGARSRPHAVARTALVAALLVGALALAWQARPPAYDY